jgi:hypothetical protein
VAAAHVPERLTPMVAEQAARLVFRRCELPSAALGLIGG